jgi:hypothetical protein
MAEPSSAPSLTYVRARTDASGATKHTRTTRGPPQKVQVFIPWTHFNSKLENENLAATLQMISHLQSKIETARRASFPDPNGRISMLKIKYPTPSPCGNPLPGEGGRMQLACNQTIVAFPIG